MISKEQYEAAKADTSPLLLNEEYEPDVDVVEDLHREILSLASQAAYRASQYLTLLDEIQKRQILLSKFDTDLTHSVMLLGVD